MPEQRPLLHEGWCRVLIPEFDTVAYDPLDPDKRYHEGVFVETNAENGSGTMFHVTGDVIAASGMQYEEKPDYSPREDVYFHGMTLVGKVLKADHDSGMISTVLRALPTPTRQQGLNFWERNRETGRYDMIWMREDGERYGPGEERRPVFKCNEWTRLYAVPALLDARILQREETASSIKTTAR